MHWKEPAELESRGAEPGRPAEGGRAQALTDVQQKMAPFPFPSTERLHIAKPKKKKKIKKRRKCNCVPLPSWWCRERKKKGRKCWELSLRRFWWGIFFFNLKCEGTGWRQTRRHTHTHTHTHREKHIFVLLSIWGCLPVTADSGAARGCRGAVWLAVIGLGVKWRTAEALAETWGQGEEGDCDSAIRLLCTQGSW